MNSARRGSSGSGLGKHYRGAVAPPEWKQYSPDPQRRSDGFDPADTAGRPEITPYAAPEELPYVRTVEERIVRRGPQGGGSKLLVLFLLAVVVVGGIVIGRADRDPGPGEVVPRLAAEPERPGPSPMGAQGFGRLLAALQERQGSTLVFQAVLHDSYAELTVPFATPVARGDQRALELFWDGTRLSDRGDTSGRMAPHDLADLARTDLAGLCTTARALLTAADSCYLIIARPDPDSNQRTLISAWASAPFDASAMVRFDRHGRKVDQTVSRPQPDSPE